MAATINGVSIEHGPVNQWVWRHAAAGTWEANTYAVIDRYVTPETTFIDIGAWIGPISLYAASKAARVIAFEPDPIAFAALQENLGLNPRISNVQAFNQAIGVAEGTVRLGVRVKPGDSTSSITFGGADGWEVQSRRLENVCRELDVVDPIFVKIDVEGYEYQLIPDLMPWLSGRRFVMHLSTHPHLVTQAVSNGGMTGFRQSMALRRANRRLMGGLRPAQAMADGAMQPINGLRRRISEIGGSAPMADRDLVVVHQMAA